MKDLQKVKDLLSQAQSLIDAMSGGEEETAEAPDASPEGEDAELPMKSFKMKLSKYKA
jgi:hypothetical protein